MTRVAILVVVSMLSTMPASGVRGEIASKSRQSGRSVFLIFISNLLLREQLCVRNYDT